MDQSHKHNPQQKNPDTKECRWFDSIYVKLKTRPAQSMVLNVRVAISLRGLALAGRGPEGECSVAGKIFFLIWVLVTCVHSFCEKLNHDIFMYFPYVNNTFINIFFKHTSCS